MNAKQIFEMDLRGKEYVQARGLSKIGIIIVKTAL